MAEVQDRIQRINNHSGVQGLIIADDQGNLKHKPPRQNNPELKSQLLAQKVVELTKKARSVIRDIEPMNDLTFFRVRTRANKEILVAPNNNLFLIVLQDLPQPSSEWMVEFKFWSKRFTKLLRL